MRAASLPRQIERENEMIVISHRFFVVSDMRLEDMRLLRFLVSSSKVLPLAYLPVRTGDDFYKRGNISHLISFSG